MAEAPQIAILGAGTFVKTQYIPRLAEISNVVSLKAMWSRTEVPQLTYMYLALDRLTRDLIIFLVQESARGAVEIARKHFPGVECKWGDKGLEEIFADSSILGVAVVLAGQAQVQLI